MARGEFEGIEPNELSWNEDGNMVVVWSDGHHSEYSRAYLRSICPCADCKGTHGTAPKAFKIVTSQQVARAGRETVILSVEPVGRYAISFTWGDQHSHGIYSWSYLRAECEAHKKAQA